MTFKTWVAVAGTLIALGACGPSDRERLLTEFGVAQRGKSTVDEILTAAASPENIFAFLADTTFIHYSDDHGTQIWYVGPEGRLFLWYPGNRRVVDGYWKVEYDPDIKDSQVFYRYPNSYNPVTRQLGDSWKTSDRTYYMMARHRMLVGDPFNLSSGKTPFIMPKDERVSFLDAMERAGLERMPPLDENTPAPQLEGS
ncbi:MAG: hypothetical protein AAFQ33_10845 [Pseudomonadota bacterium]